MSGPQAVSHRAAGVGGGCALPLCPHVLGNGALPPTEVPRKRGTSLGRRRRNERTAFELRIRGPAGLRARRTVCQRPATSVAADADVRPHLRNRRGRRRIWQGTGARRPRSQTRPLVLPLSFQGRSGDAGMPRPRCAVAAARLLPRLARVRPARVARSAWARSSSPAGAADHEEASSTASTSNG